MARGPQVKGFKGIVFVAPREAAARQAPTVPQDFSKVPVSHLELDTNQHEAIKKQYSTHQVFSQTYGINEVEQITAAAVLAAEQLDFDARESLGNKWYIKWTGKGSHGTQRVLYQCACGCDSSARASMKSRHPHSFTGCLAHAEVTYDATSSRVSLIRGHFEHNDACSTAILAGKPQRRVHPDVYEHALKQLKAGASVSTIKETNISMSMAGAYPSQKTANPARYRWKMKKFDMRSLYRQFYRLQGVRITEKDYVNLDEWLNPGSPQYNPVLHAAIFHYSARHDLNERLEVCIATAEMRNAAWKYAHHSQLILDGTFGVCNKKMLLFIAMAVDEANRGVPLAFFLFSAPRGNQQTSAGYDTDVLARLLTSWKHSLGRRGGEPFDISVAITDTDLMERAALLRVFPDVWLLICRFHLLQSWKNHRNLLLRGLSLAGTWQHDLTARLKVLENALLEAKDFATAKQLIQDERTALLAMQDAPEYESDGNTIIAISGALQHVAYLDDYWTRDWLWQSWSQYSRHAAAERLGRLVDEVLPTTNHLESFNGVLKRVYLVRWQRGGRRLRLDILVLMLITQVLPSVYRQHELEDIESARETEAIRALPGGAQLLEASATRKKTFYAVAYLVSDPLREASAAEIVRHAQISVPTVDPTSPSNFMFTCFSSLATIHDTHPTTYHIVLSTTGTGSCTCVDFTTRGGACKHMRAALLRSSTLRAQGISLPDFPLPSSVDEAYATCLQALRSDTDDIADISRAVNDLVLETISALPDLDAGDDPESLQDDDEESVVTSDDHANDHPANAHILQSMPEHHPVLKSHDAFTEQAIARVIYELEHTPSKYGQLAHWLTDAHLAPGCSADLKHLAALRDRCAAETDALVGELSRLLLEAADEPVAVTTAPPRTPSPTVPVVVHAAPQRLRSRKRHAPSIIGPSPEKRAPKRHDSHAPH